MPPAKKPVRTIISKKTCVECHTETQTWNDGKVTLYRDPFDGTNSMDSFEYISCGKCGNEKPHALRCYDLTHNLISESPSRKIQSESSFKKVGVVPPVIKSDLRVRPTGLSDEEWWLILGRRVDSVKS